VRAPCPRPRPRSPAPCWKKICEFCCTDPAISLLIFAPVPPWGSRRSISIHFLQAPRSTTCLHFRSSARSCQLRHTMGVPLFKNQKTPFGKERGSRFRGVPDRPRRGVPDSRGTRSSPSLRAPKGLSLPWPHVSPSHRWHHHSEHVPPLPQSQSSLCLEGAYG
jgi:hypothetical protein